MFLTDAADVLRAAGLNVVELDGWKDRGETDGAFNPIAIILHHDAEGLGFDSDPANDNNVPEYMSQSGNNGAQFWVRRDGTWFCLAAGRKWHAGVGQGYGQIPANSGNSYAAGVETDHTTGDTWEAQQVNAINAGCRALVKHYGWIVGSCCGHREYAPDRKIDPENFDLDAWRAFLSSPVNPTPTIPPEEDVPLSPEDVEKVADAVWERIYKQPNSTVGAQSMESFIGGIRQYLEELDERIAQVVRQNQK